MRVISGSARGLRLYAPKGLTTRPTVDKIKESLFNIINSSLPEAAFLDLFSGSGAIGIEALSRGAKRAVFVDSSNDSIEAIKRNLKASRLSEHAVVIKMSAAAAIKYLAQNGERFDIIFMDPPYSKSLVDTALAAIDNERLLANDGFIIAEQSIDEPEPNIAGLEVFRIKEYKITKMTFLRQNF